MLSAELLAYDDSGFDLNEPLLQAEEALLGDGEAASAPDEGCASLSESR